MDDTSRAERRWNPASVAIALGIVLTGVGVLAGVTYANVTADVEGDYQEFAGNCGDLADESYLVDTGIGARTESVNQSQIETCRNTSYGEYRQARVDSMQATPFNPVQWGLYGGAGIGILVTGVVVVRQELGLA